jgi:peptidoglycan/xylan/chitin deacetylase (PgdA/CDA1 family)
MSGTVLRRAVTGSSLSLRYAGALATLAVAAVLVLPAEAGNRLRPVPILMYHVLSAPPANAPYPELYVAPPDFRAQIAWLAAHGYRAVTLQRVFDAWRGAATLPARPVVLTFDDGYLSDVRTALPALKARHWPGVLNLEVANLKPVWGIRPPGVRKLLAAGWELDAHTLTHPDLTKADAARLREEVTGSRAAIRKMFHVRVNFFCYPAGRYDADVIAAVQQAGYLGATTTNYGLARPGDLYTLARVRINGSDGVKGFAAKLTALSS